MSRSRLPDRTTLLTWLAVALATAFVLAETMALRDAGHRLRAQEAADAQAAAGATPAPAAPGGRPR